MSRAARVALTLLAIALVARLGAAQLAASAAYGDLATRHSLPAFLHRHDPTLLRAALLGGAPARIAADIHTGALDEARRLLTGAPADTTTDDLRGQLAQARGAHEEALADYIAAADFVRAQAHIDALPESAVDEAIPEEQQLIARLSPDVDAGEALGQAYWRLGVLEATQGYHDVAHRAAHWRDAQRAYELALSEAPNDETYLLAAAYQELANGDTAAGRAHDERALQVDPASAPAYGGLAFAAVADGDCASARADAARSSALAPNAAPLTDNPTFGAKLAACLTK
ncbi:MAG TPA: hypothetical protein VMD91_12140 [Candidatus Sulfotelmatobacter sp.]|nr:hypothetical protein [Candidatus Sulfotelmatobacter sp.]